MDGRDLARCLAVEAHNDTHAYTVSMESGAVYGPRHLNANFNRGGFVKEAKRRWGANIRFRQIVLDYFWIPRGSWVMTHWSHSFFETTLCDFVREGMLDFSPGSPRVDGLARGSNDQEDGNGFRKADGGEEWNGGGGAHTVGAGHGSHGSYRNPQHPPSPSESESDEWENYNYEPLSTLSAAAVKASSSGMGACAGVVYLPFCLHCVKHVVASIDTLSQYYAISFLYRAELFEHALWAATSTIDKDAMQNWLGKARDQEEAYCTFRPSEFLNSADDSYVHKEVVLDVLRRIEDFREVRMIKLKALKVWDPLYSGKNTSTSTGGARRRAAEGHDEVTSKRGNKKRKRSKLSSKLLSHSPRTATDLGGFVGLKHPDEVRRGFDFERMGGKKDDAQKTAASGDCTTKARKNSKHRRKNAATPAPHIWTPTNLVVVIGGKEVSGSVQADADELEILAGRIDRLCGANKGLGRKPKKKRERENEIYSWNGGTDDEDEEEEEIINEGDDNDEEFIVLGNYRVTNTIISTRSSAQMIDKASKQEQSELITTGVEGITQVDCNKHIIEQHKPNDDKIGTRSHDNDNSNALGVKCKAPMDQTCNGMDIIKAQYLDDTIEKATSSDDKTCAEKNDAEKMHMSDQHTIIEKNEQEIKVQQASDKNDEITEHHKLIVKCEAGRKDEVKEGDTIIDAHQSCNEEMNMVDGIRKDKKMTKNTDENMEERKPPVYNDDGRICHGLEAAGEQPCIISKQGVVLDEGTISGTVEATNDAPEGGKRRIDEAHNANGALGERPRKKSDRKNMFSWNEASDEEIISSTVQAPKDELEVRTRRFKRLHNANDALEETPRKKSDRQKIICSWSKTEVEEGRESHNEDQYCARKTVEIGDGIIEERRPSSPQEYSQHRTIFRLPNPPPYIVKNDLDVNSKPTGDVEAIINQKITDCENYADPSFPDVLSKGQYGPMTLNKQLKQCNFSSAPFEKIPPYTVINVNNLYTKQKSSDVVNGNGVAKQRHRIGSCHWHSYITDDSRNKSTNMPPQILFPSSAHYDPIPYYATMRDSSINNKIRRRPFAINSHDAAERRHIIEDYNRQQYKEKHAAHRIWDLYPQSFHPPHDINLIGGTFSGCKTAVSYLNHYSMSKRDTILRVSSINKKVQNCDTAKSLTLISKTDIDDVYKPCTVSEQSEDYLDDESVASNDTLCPSQGKTTDRKENKHAAHVLLSMRKHMN